MFGKRSLVVAAALLMVGCIPERPLPPGEPVDLTPNDLVGAWHDTEADGMLVFESDGTFTATNLPPEMFWAFPEQLPPGFNATRHTLPATGEWEIIAPITNPDGLKNSITFRIHFLAGREIRSSRTLFARRLDGNVILNYYVGDPDLNVRIVYERCHSKCPTPSRRANREGCGALGGIVIMRRS
jgi:hypothetical protein